LLREGSCHLWVGDDEMKTLRHASVARGAAIVIFCVALCCATSRAQTPAATIPSDAAKPLYKEVIDELGRTIHVPQPVQRIVSLAPSLTETIYALGLQDRLVGDTDYCDYPADAQKKTKVGGPINPSIEQIVALRPDLVLVTKSLNRLETVHALSDLGISSYATDPHTVQQIVTSAERLAEVLGAADAGATLGADLDHKLAELQERLNGIPPRRVLFIVWSEPLISVGPNTFIADALRHAGATSIVDSSQDWPQMNLEEIVRLQPDFLIFAAAHSDSAQSDFEVLAQRPGWRGLDAVRNRHFAVISDAVNRPAPRIISAIEDLARQLHPEAFAVRPEEGGEKKNAAPQRSSQPMSVRPNGSSAVNATPQEACACAL
jgi:iron complex transport system substrate-binding protein